MNEDISEQIARLPAMNKAQLLDVWTKHFKNPPPPTLRKQLMVPVLAYRIQEQEFGGLSQRARRRLEEIAAGLDGKRGRPSLKTEGPPQGARIVRVWRGELHEVFCTDDGYSYRGKRFSSLSSLAKEITGTHRSGPAFFGTREKAK
jgi:hypothetical protein